MNHDDFPKGLLAVLDASRESVEVTLIERGEVVHNANEIVTQLENQIYYEVLCRLLFHDTQRSLYLDW